MVVQPFGGWTGVHVFFYFGSVVLPDGRVLVEGGEYNCASGSCNAVWTNQGAIYDPHSIRRLPEFLIVSIGSLLWYVRSASPCPKTQKIYADEQIFLAIRLFTAMAVDSGGTQEGCFCLGECRSFLRGVMGINWKDHTFALGKNWGGFLTFVSRSNP
jgi:hypothetical protein